MRGVAARGAIDDNPVVLLSPGERKLPQFSSRSRIRNGIRSSHDPKYGEYLTLDELLRRGYVKQRGKVRLTRWLEVYRVVWVELTND